MLIINFFVMIQDSFVYKLPNFQELTSLLLSITLTTTQIPPPTKEKVHKVIQKNSVSILNALVSLIDLNLSNDDYIKVNQIVNSLEMQDMSWGVKFVSFFLTDFSERINFSALQNFSTGIKLTKIHHMESILINSCSFLDNFIEILCNTIKVFQGFLGCKKQREFVKYMKKGYSEGLFAQAGVFIPKIAGAAQNNSWGKFKKIFVEWKLDKFFNMLSFYCLNVSVINEAFTTLSSLLTSGRRVTLKKALHRRRFVQRFMNPLAEILFDRRVEQRIAVFVS